MTTDNIQAATQEEVKTEETTIPAYVPNLTQTVQIDPLSHEAFLAWQKTWSEKFGARLTKMAEELEAKEAEIAKVKADLETFKTAQVKLQAAAAKKQEWAEIARLQGLIEAAEKEAQKAIDKLNKVTSKAGNEETTADKLTWQECREGVFQFKFDSKAFVVAHSSKVNAQVLKKAGLKQPEADVFVAFSAEPVETVRENGRHTTDKMPVITGQPVKLEISLGERQSNPKHSTFTNGIAKALKKAGLIVLSDSTMYQPFKPESLIINPRFDWLTVKEG